MNNEEKILNILSNLTNKVDSIDNKSNSMQSQLDALKSQTSENTQILKALEHNSEVHKAEIDNLTHTVTEISGDVKSIKSAVTKGQKAYDYLENFNKFSSSENQ
jgi:uncharacterized protein YoxC